MGKPPIFGMIQHGGDVVMRMLANVQQATLAPLLQNVRRRGKALLGFLLELLLT